MLHLLCGAGSEGKGTVKGTRGDSEGDASTRGGRVSDHNSVAQAFLGRFLSLL